jgi:hypothetical protein
MLIGLPSGKYDSLQLDAFLCKAYLCFSLAALQQRGWQGCRKSQARSALLAHERELGRCPDGDQFFQPVSRSTRAS